MTLPPITHASGMSGMSGTPGNAASATGDSGADAGPSQAHGQAQAQQAPGAGLPARTLPPHALAPLAKVATASEKRRRIVAPAMAGATGVPAPAAMPTAPAESLATLPDDLIAEIAGHHPLGSRDASRLRGAHSRFAALLKIRAEADGILEAMAAPLDGVAPTERFAALTAAAQQLHGGGPYDADASRLRHAVLLRLAEHAIADPALPPAATLQMFERLRQTLPGASNAEERFELLNALTDMFGPRGHDRNEPHDLPQAPPAMAAFHQNFCNDCAALSHEHRQAMAARAAGAGRQEARPASGNRMPIPDSAEAMRSALIGMQARALYMTPDRAQRWEALHQQVTQLPADRRSAGLSGLAIAIRHLPPAERWNAWVRLGMQMTSLPPAQRPAVLTELAYATSGMPGGEAVRQAHALLQPAILALPPADKPAPLAALIGAIPFFCRFPDHWRQPLRQMIAEVRKLDAPQRSVPVQALHETMIHCYRYDQLVPAEGAAPDPIDPATIPDIEAVDRMVAQLPQAQRRACLAFAYRLLLSEEPDRMDIGEANDQPLANLNFAWGTDTQQAIIHGLHACLAGLEANAALAPVLAGACEMGRNFTLASEIMHHFDLVLAKADGLAPAVRRDILARAGSAIGQALESGDAHDLAENVQALIDESDELQHDQRIRGLALLVFLYNHEAHEEAGRPELHDLVSGLDLEARTETAEVVSSLLGQHGANGILAADFRAALAP